MEGVSHKMSQNGCIIFEKFWETQLQRFEKVSEYFIMFIEQADTLNFNGRTIDNRLGTLIQQALERLLTQIWVRGLFRLRARSIETSS